MKFVKLDQLAGNWFCKTYRFFVEDQVIMSFHLVAWRKRQQSRASVRLTIETVLDELPRVYTKELYRQKCDIIYQHVYDAYFGKNSSIFAHA